MIFQNPDTQLFNATIREEILYKVVNPNFQLYEWLLEVLNLKKYEDLPPLLLSEGEKRRVALATALMRENRHGILLDEPSLGQDEYHKSILIHVLRSLANSGYLVMFSTHDLELASQADQMVLFNPGRSHFTRICQRCVSGYKFLGENGLNHSQLDGFSCLD